MRIYCFNNLVEEESEKLSLKDCSVVIDGTNFLHNIYKKSKLPFVFGCETDKYAELLKQQLTMFKQANVKCYIVFKGGDTDMEKKMKKFQHVVYFDIDRYKDFIPPELLKDTNVQVVDEMGIDYAFCVTEVKDECVALAQKLNCAIISYDIEYCFRKVPYIPWSMQHTIEHTIEFDDETKSIKCRQYKLQDFLKKKSLTKEKVAIFAALTDQTVFHTNYFVSLFNNWGVFYESPDEKLKNLIFWLSKHSEEEARDGISKVLRNAKDKRKFELNYNKILSDMEKDEPGHVTEYLLNSNIPIMKQDPEWFEKGVVCKHVPPVYINLYKWKVIQGSWAILHTQSEDSLLLSIDIIKYAYNLLTNYWGDTIKVYQDWDRYVQIRTNESNVCRPVYDCKESVFENGWDEVKQLKLFEHFLTENCINAEVLSQLPSDSVILFTALIYFARKKELKGEDVTKEVYAVVLSYILLNLEKNSEDHFNIKRIAAKYFEYDEEEAKSIFDVKTSEKLVELQFCIQHMNYLNTLCGSPYETTRYSKMYNGTFIYKMCRAMRDQNVDDFVNELFHTTPIVIGKVQRFIQVYRELL